AEIGDRRFDLDDPERAVGPERNKIGSAARWQRQLAHHRMSHRMQEPRGAARDRQRSFRLAAIGRKRSSKATHRHRMENPRQRNGNAPVRTHATPPHANTLRNTQCLSIYSAAAARSAKATLIDSRLAGSIPRSVISPVTKRAGVTSKP